MLIYLFPAYLSVGLVQSAVQRKRLQGAPSSTGVSPPTPSWLESHQQLVWQTGVTQLQAGEALQFAQHTGHAGVEVDMHAAGKESLQVQKRDIAAGFKTPLRIWQGREQIQTLEVKGSRISESFFSAINTVIKNKLDGGCVKLLNGLYIFKIASSFPFYFKKDSTLS